MLVIWEFRIAGIGPEDVRPCINLYAGDVEELRKLMPNNEFIRRFESNNIVELTPSEAEQLLNDLRKLGKVRGQRYLASVFHPNIKSTLSRAVRGIIQFLERCQKHATAQPK